MLRRCQDVHVRVAEYLEALFVLSEREFAAEIFYYLIRVRFLCVHTDVSDPTVGVYLH